MAPRGPLVRPSVHRGSLLLIAGVLQFVAAMIAVQWKYPGYSDLANTISDLGNSSKSPWSDTFNVSLVILAAAALVGTVLVRSAFPARRTRLGGIGLLGLSFLGVLGVGLFPEGSPHGLHTFFSALTFLAGGLGLLLLSFAMLRDTRWGGFRLYTLVSAVVSLVAFLLLAFAPDPLTNAGVYGGVERVVVGPLLLWAVLAGIHLLRIPSYAPATVVDRSSSH
jgi:hypothetical membrane protein